MEGSLVSLVQLKETNENPEKPITFGNGEVMDGLSKRSKW